MALKLFKKAYEQGNHNSSLYLGDMYLKSKGVNKDQALSYQYLFQGDYTRCCYLGNMLFNGISVSKSTIKAIEYWFLGLDHYNCQHCFLQISNYFGKNKQIISAFRNFSISTFLVKYKKIWSD